MALCLPFLLICPKKLLPYPFWLISQLFPAKKPVIFGGIKEPENEVCYKTHSKYPLEKYTAGFTGSKTFSLGHKNKPHVVFLYLESFRSSDIQKVTPHFDRLSKKGVFFSKFYASATQTFKAMFATLYGLPPCFGMDFTESSSPVLTLPLKGLPSFFKDAGYKNIFLKAGSHNFDNQGDFLRNHDFDEIYDEVDVKRSNADAYGTSWGVHDEFMYEFLVDKIKNAKTPLFINAASVTNHHPFVNPESFTPFFGKTPFEKTMEYTDHALGAVVEKLSSLKIPMHIYIMGDHGYPLNHKGRPGLSPSLDKDVTHVPFLILPLHCGKFHPQEINSTSSQIDILPTMMDLYGFSGLNSSIGSTLLRKRKNPEAFLLNESIDPMSGVVTDNSYEVTPGYHPLYNTLKKLYKDRLISSVHDDLKTLNLSSLFVPNSDLQVLLDNNRNLESLYLDNSPIITSLDFTYPKSLKKITLENNILINDEDITLLPTSIECISISGCRNLTDKSLQYLAKLPIKEMSLSCKNFSTNALAKFILSIPIEKIWIKDAEHIEESFFLSFAKHELKEITISGASSLSDASIKAISSPYLKTFMSDDCSLLSDLSLKYLKKSPLEILHLEKAFHLSDTGIKHLLSLRVHTFFISHSRHITESGIDLLNTPFMRNLFCVDCKLMPEVFKDTPEKQMYFLSNQKGES